MTEATTLDQNTRLQRQVWLTGGILLVLWAVISVIDIAIPMTVPGSEWVLRVIFAAATLVFALGWKSIGSVTARRPVGTAALILLGLWPFFTELVYAFVPIEPDFFVWSNVLELVRLVVAVVAVVAIVSAGVVARPWAWAPAIGLAIYVLGQAGMSLVMLGFQESLVEQSLPDVLLIFAVMHVVGVIHACAVAGIGIVAIVLAYRI